MQNTYNLDQLEALNRRGARYMVIQKHELNGVPAGTVTSWHKTYDAAAREVGSSSFEGIHEIADVIFYTYA